MQANATRTSIFSEGDPALLIDRKGRRYMVRLEHSADFHTHIGHFSHDELLGKDEGAWVVTSKGHYLLAVRPTMSDYTLEMPRIATVVYPKDVGAILVYGDIFPGARVLEAGTGSGALTAALLRAVGPQGSVASYDVREDMLERARSNVAALFADTSNLSLKLGDVGEGFDEDGLDRIVLDLPEPWHVAPHAEERLLPGGIFLSFLPTILQVHQLTQTLRERRTFDLIETFEVMQRSWTVGRRNVRPDHRMVAHTGFVTTARRCSPRPQAVGGDA